MIYIIFSDLHSNLESLQAFAEDIRTIKHDKKVFLGDAVGYGADPNACVEWLRENVDIILAGNHDYAVVGKTSLGYFNSHARHVCLWTQQALTKDNKRFLGSLSIAKEEDGIFWAHSSPYEPAEWDYVNSISLARKNFEYFKAPACFIGHSHLPWVFKLDADENVESHSQTFAGRLENYCRYIINVGSLGQPRDGSPDPVYMVYDSETQLLEHRRFKYDSTATRSKIINNGFPAYLAERLIQGR